MMRPELSILNRDQRLDDPIITARFVVRSAIGIVRAQRYPNYVAGIIPEDRAPRIMLGAIIAPINGEPRCE